MKAATSMNKSMDALLRENDSLCRQLARLQQRASELIQQRSAEVEQLSTVVEYLNSELHNREVMILFLRTKLREFRKINEPPSLKAQSDQLVCK